MLTSLRTALAVALVAVSLSAQCTTSAPFNNNTSTLGQVELNIATGSDSTNNSLFTPTAQDNEATASLGEVISFNVSNSLGSAGNPVSIYFTPSSPGAPLAVPGLGDLYLNLANFASMVDGAGFLGPATPFAAHPGPFGLYSLFTAVPQTPSLNNSCYTFQAIVIDPSFPGAIRLGNASALQLRAAITGIVGPNFGPEGSALTVTSSGAGTGTVHMPGFDPSNSPSLPDTVSAALVGNAGTVPIGAGSGALQYEDAGSPGLIATNAADDMNTFFAVVDPLLGVQNNATVGALTLNTSPNNANESWASVTQILATSTQVDTWTISVNAGDIVHVELYSLDTAQSRILDGSGSIFTPNATQGFDPGVNIAHATNVQPLTFDTGSIAPFNVHGDDDSGPGFNASATFQARSNDTLQILVGSFLPGTFVTGDYLLNVRVLAGEPAVGSFSIAGIATANVGGFGETVTVNGPNIQAGFVYDVTLTPVHGLYPPVTITNNPSTLAGQVSFILPAQVIGSFDVGSHFVTVTDATGTNGTSLRWSTEFFTQPFGPLPDILCVTSSVLTPQAGAPLAASTSYVHGPIVGPFAYAGFSNDSNGLPIVAGQTIYAEIVGVDVTNNRLMDGVAEEGNAAQGVFNPMMTIFDPTLTQIASNDDDGVVPTAFNWPNSGSAGLGQGSAAIITAPVGAGAGYTLFYWENICWVSCAQAKTGIINLVIY